jgi:hypothetical protein
VLALIQGFDLVERYGVKKPVTKEEQEGQRAIRTALNARGRFKLPLI